MGLVEASASASCAVSAPDCDDTMAASVDVLPAVVIAAAVVVTVLVVFVVIALRGRRHR